MLEEKTENDKIEVLPDGTLQVRRATVILKDGVEITRTYHRYSVVPGDSADDPIDPRVKALATLLHTPAAVKAYKDRAARAVELAPGLPPTEPPRGKP